MQRSTALALCALLLGGCALDPRELTLRLRPAEAIGCQPTEVRSVVLQPLGDSPSSDRPSVRLDLSRVSTIETFPPATVSVAVLAQGEIVGPSGSTLPWTGGGIAVLDGVEATELSVPLLTLRRSCSLADTAMSAFVGSAITTLPDGRLLIAGGEREFESLRIVTLGLGDPVFFRHAKAGELAEHLTAYHLVRGARVEARAATYRGMGLCWLG